MEHKPHQPYETQPSHEQQSTRKPEMALAHKPTAEAMQQFPNHETARKEKRVDIDSYGDIFPQTVIDADKAELLKKGIAIKQKEAALNEEDRAGSMEAKKIAGIMEDLTVSLGNSPAWIPGARFIKASEYDDLCKGTDLIIEIVQGKTGRPLTIAVDVTIGRHEVSKKLKTIVTPGDRKFEIPSLKYYPALKYDREHRNDEGAKPTAVAKLVLGASTDTIRETQAALRAAQGNNEAFLAARNTNRLKFAILEGGKAQAEGLRNYAEAIGQTGTAKLYDLIAKYFSRAIEAHTQNFGAFPEEYARKSDPVLDEIVNIERSRDIPKKLAVA